MGHTRLASATAYAGKTIAQFKVGDSRCVVIDDQIRCTAVTQ